jgi:hypothetical protein
MRMHACAYACAVAIVLDPGIRTSTRIVGRAGGFDFFTCCSSTCKHRKVHVYFDRGSNSIDLFLQDIDHFLKTEDIGIWFIENLTDNRNRKAQFEVSAFVGNSRMLAYQCKKKKHVLNALLLPPNSSAVFELFLSILGKIINEPDSNVFNFEKVINVMQRFN